ncbi:ejaculatory bulb-specific protein 3-like [Anabrus simplex]|uniref:ejaculatory bulb-specific protein 3-like n=1 Tax=Anabrus simplex TaxID=316456 RepID=UPI0035A39C16
MNRVLALCVLLATVAVVLAEDTYTTKWDNINVDEILSNERLRKVYLDCLLAADDKSCAEEGKALRSALPDALATECKKCTDKQKEKAEKVIKWIIENNADAWKKLKAKWDPTGEYTKKYEEEARKRGINV